MEAADPNHVTGMQQLKNTMNSSGFKRSDYLTNSSASVSQADDSKGYVNKKIRYKHPDDKIPYNPKDTF